MSIVEFDVTSSCPSRPAAGPACGSGGCGVRPRLLGVRLLTVVCVGVVTLAWMVLTCCGRGCLNVLRGRVRSVLAALESLLPTPAAGGVRADGETAAEAG